MLELWFQRFVDQPSHASVARAPLTTSTSTTRRPALAGAAAS